MRGGISFRFTCASARDPAKFDIDRLAAESAGRSGAEIEQAIIAAMHNAFAVREKLTTDYVVAALKSSPPLSVTMAESIARLRAWAKTRCVPAD